MYEKPAAFSGCATGVPDVIGVNSLESLPLTLAHALRIVVQGRCQKLLPFTYLQDRESSAGG